MTKFFNVFLLNILLFSQKHHFDARTVNPGTLDKIPLEIGDSVLSKIGSFSKLHKGNEALGRIPNEIKQKEFRSKRQVSSESYPIYFAPNYLPRSVPEYTEKNGNDAEKSEYLNPMRYWRGDTYTNCMKDVIKKWRSLIARNRRKRVLRYLSSLAPDDTSEYLDYTNSQMPFNEGRARHKTFQEKRSEVFDDSSNKGKGLSELMNSLALQKEPIRFGRLIRKRFEVPLRSQEKNFEIFGDDPILKYSRVRRFLDHERAKKRKRTSSTLEAKEAAMSRVLDPNVNLEGILEPHVRKRRGQNYKKMLPELPLKIQHLRSESGNLNYI